MNVQYINDASYVSIESIAIHTSYFNVSSNSTTSRLANNLLFYDTAQPAYILPDGYYDLQTLNKILYTNLYKIGLNSTSQNYTIQKYTNGTDWTNELNGTVQAVQTFGLLNKTIYDGSFFCNIIKMECSFVDAYSTIGSTILDSHNIIEIPITAQKMSYQVIYYTGGISSQLKFKLSGSNNVLWVWFLDYNDNVIFFNPLYTPTVVFEFTA